MQITLQQNQTQYSRFGSYLNQQHFMGTLVLAILLHIGGVALYHLLPQEVTEMIPVRVLNIKIGKTPPLNAVPPGQESGKPEGENLKSSQPEVKKPEPVKAVKAAPKPAPRPQPKAAPKAKPPVKAAKVVKREVVAPKKNPMVPTPESSVGKAKAKTAEDIARQYIREDSLAAARAGIQGGLPAESYGSPLGNSREASAEIEKRYTQTLSLWINRFKIYPVEARQAGIGGTVMLRLRINRQGRILQYYLEKPSGYQVIDQAISRMVNAANPVPAVPPYYPDSRPYLEFLVPIHFKP